MRSSRLPVEAATLTPAVDSADAVENPALQSTPHISSVDSDAGPDAEQKLSDRASSCCGCLKIKWAAEMTHDMLSLWICSTNFQSKSREEQLTSCRIRRNPLYWLLAFLPTFCAIVVGRLFHSLFGQGGPVRVPESRIERETRVHWVYCCDGMLFAIFLLDVIILLFFWATHHPWSRYYVQYLVAVGLYVCYLCGNVLFLRAIRLRHQTGVRIAILSNLAFFIALLGAFVYDIYKAERDDDFSNTPSSVLIVMMLLRISFILYEILAFYVYSKLWSLYSADQQPTQCTETAWNALRALLLLLYTVAITGVVGVGFAKSNYLWNAIA